MPKLISLVGVILIFPLSVCYCVENDPQNAFDAFHPPSSSSSSFSSASSSAKIEDDKYGNSKELQDLVEKGSGARTHGLNWVSAEDRIRRKRSASMNGGILPARQLDFVEVPDVRYDRRTSRMLHPGDVKYTYDTGYDTALEDPSGQEVVGPARDDVDWRNTGGIGDEDRSSDIWKTLQELTLLNELSNQEPAHQPERKRKWKSKNMAMWG